VPDEALANWREAVKRGASGLDVDARTTVIVDVGGGSTELAAMVDGVLESYSMQLGCVRVTERALGKGWSTSDAVDAATAMIAEQLDAAWHAVPAFATRGDVRLIGLAGFGVDTCPARRANGDVRPRLAAPPSDLARDGVRVARSSRQRAARGSTDPSRDGSRPRGCPRGGSLRTGGRDGATRCRRTAVVRE